MPPMLLGFLRFICAGAFAFFLPRPKIAIGYLFLLSLFMFVMQFSFVFSSMKLGMPTGMISVLVQAQAFFTIFYMSIYKRQFPRLQVIIGSVVAICGLLLIYETVGTGKDVTGLEILLVMGAACTWAFGNVLMARLGQVDMLATITWMSVMAIIPFAILSLIFEGTEVILDSLRAFDGITAISILYIGLISTTVCYGGWGWLIRHYGAAEVAPFSLLVPITGLSLGTIVMGEPMTMLRAGGIALILCGLLILNFGNKAATLVGKGYRQLR